MIKSEPSNDVRGRSAAQPAPGALRLKKDSRAQKFLAALDEAAYENDDEPAKANLLRELVERLWWGNLMDVPHTDEDQQEDFAMKKLDEVIELVVKIRMAWINSGQSEQARNIAGRRLEELEGDMSDEELKSCHNYYMNSLVWMNEEKRAEYERLKHEQHLLLKLKDKENSYGRRKQQLPPGAYLASYH